MRANGRTGRMGEFLAAFLFEEAGIEAAHVDRDGSDLWVKLPNGTIKTVDVKAATRPVLDPRKKTHCRYDFNTRHQQRPDFYAMVALDQRRMIVLPREEVTGATVKLAKHRFTDEAMAESIERMKA